MLTRNIKFGNEQLKTFHRLPLRDIKYRTFHISPKQQHYFSVKQVLDLRITNYICVVKTRNIFSDSYLRIYAEIAQYCLLI